MKYFLVAACLLSLQAQAQESCSSVWIFKANKICSHISHGPDKSRPGVAGIQAQWSSWVRGGKDQEQICRNVRDSVASAEGSAVLNRSTPIAEEKNEYGFRQFEYRYLCELLVMTYPGRVAQSPACGKQEAWSYQVGGLKPAGANCLSCDDLQSASAEEMVECLKISITEVITPKAIDLRDGDIQAVSKQVKRLLKINKDYRPIGNLQTPQDLGVFIDFLEKN